MSQEIVIDVNAVEVGEKYPDFMASRYCTKCPPFEKLMEALEKGEDISPALRSEMEKLVECNDKTRSKRMFNAPTGKTAIERVRSTSYSQFQIEQVLATALHAMDQGDSIQTIKSKVDNDLDSLKTEMHAMFEKDIDRPGRVLNINGQMVNVTSTKDLQTLFPELTGEQVGYIQALGQQGMLTNSWSISCFDLVSQQGKIANREDNILLHIGVKDGKTQLTSSIKVQILDPDSEKPMEKQRDNPENIVMLSSVVDITNLRGSEFKIGRATADVPMRAVYSNVLGDNNALLSELVSQQISNPGEALIQSKSQGQELSRVIEGARKQGIPVQNTFGHDAIKDSSIQHEIRENSTAAIERRRNLYERFLGSQKGERSKADIEANFLQSLHHSKEFMADRMADEYLGNTELWKSWKGYASATAEFPKVSNKEAAATQIYSVLEEDTNKRFEYAAAKLVQYLEGQTIDPDSAKTGQAIKAIADPLVETAQGLFGKQFLQQVKNLHNIKEDPEGYKCSLEALVYSAMEQDPTKQLNYASNKLLEYVSASPNPSKEAVTSIVSPMLPGGTRILDRDADLILRAAKESKELPLKDRFMKIVDKVRISVGMVSQDVAKVATQVKAERKGKRSFVEMEQEKKAEGLPSKTPRII